MVTATVVVITTVLLRLSLLPAPRQRNLVATKYKPAVLIMALSRLTTTPLFINFSKAKRITITTF